jgi:UDP-glucose:(heptosyl)LPS alpha-1,3-glucosyltransferase
MRVALVYEYFSGRDSLARDRILLARALVDAGVEVEAFCARGEGSEVPGVVVHEFDPGVSGRGRIGRAAEYASFATRATKRLRRDRARYDIVDVAGTTAWEHDVIRVHAVQIGVQRRWPSQGGRDFRFAGVRGRLAHVSGPRIGVARAIQRLQLRSGRYARALAVADEVRDDLVRYYYVPAERIEVLHCPIDIDRIARAKPAALRERIGASPDEAVALFVGHDFARKGLRDAIEALGRADAPLRLAVVGGGEADGYRELARREGVEERVHFLGDADAAEPYFAAADLFVLPTREEIWGIAVIEAMAAGLPVVVSDDAGAASVVRDAEAGHVVPGGSIRDLRDALTRLARDGAERRRLGNNGRGAVSTFGIRPFGDAVLRAYERVLAERAAGSE